MPESDAASVPVLQARRATKRYRSAAGDVMALSGVDLVVRPGEFVIVIGPSGQRQEHPCSMCWQASTRWMRARSTTAAGR